MDMAPVGRFDTVAIIGEFYNKMEAGLINVDGSGALACNLKRDDCGSTR